jgi:hypothetical protein
MPERDEIEQQIRDVLSRESHAIPLSNQLFSPDGLFSRLAATEEERRSLVQSPLFREAKRRFLELQQAEAKEFARVVEQAEAAEPMAKYLHKLERVETG